MEPSPAQSLTVPLVGFVISLLACSLLSFLETSVTALRLYKLKELARRTSSRYHGYFLALENNPQRVLISILIASCLANVATASFADDLMSYVFSSMSVSHEMVAKLIGIGFATIAILIIGEIIPKSFAKGRGEDIFLSTVWVSNLIFRLFYPLVTVLLKFSQFTTALLQPKGSTEEPTGSEWVASEQEIQFLIEHINQLGLMESEKTQMLKSIFALSQTQVKDIMVPATDIVAIDHHATVQETLNLCAKHHYTRLPVYESTKDNVVGMAHLKDVFMLAPTNSEKSIKEVMRPITFIPETLMVNQLLREFREKHIHIAMVVNEYGNLIGLVTLEDVLEEIVGEINDEHELTPEKILPLNHGGWMVDGTTSLESVEEKLGISFEDVEDAHSIGGFLIEQLHRLPRKGDNICYKGFCFQVQRASNKRVEQILIFASNKEETTK